MASTFFTRKSVASLTPINPTSLVRQAPPGPSRRVGAGGLGTQAGTGPIPEPPVTSSADTFICPTAAYHRYQLCELGLGFFIKQGYYLLYRTLERQKQSRAVDT